MQQCKCNKMETYCSLEQEGAPAAITENSIKMQETLASCGGYILENSVNGETVMGKIKTLWQK